MNEEKALHNAAPPPSPSPAPPWSTWITPKAAGTRLGLSSRTIRRMVAAGILAGRNISAGKQARYVVDPDSLAAAARPATSNN